MSFTWYWCERCRVKGFMEPYTIVPESCGGQEGCGRVRTPANMSWAAVAWSWRWNLSCSEHFKCQGYGESIKERYRDSLVGPRKKLRVLQAELKGWSFSNPTKPRRSCKDLQMSDMEPLGFVVVLVGFCLALDQSFLDIVSLISFRMGIFTLCHRTLLCNLLVI